MVKMTKQNVLRIKISLKRMNNNIPLIESCKNKSADLMVVCESQDTRDELENLLTSSNEEIVMSTPREIRPAITVVGFPKEYKKEEITNMLVLQNGSLFQTKSKTT